VTGLQFTWLGNGRDTSDRTSVHVARHWNRMDPTAHRLVRSIEPAAIKIRIPSTALKLAGYAGLVSCRREAVRGRCVGNPGA
jgi:hypothetical protein